MSSFGLTRKHLDELGAIFRKVILNGQHLKVWIFGSRATGAYKPFSDVDLLLEAEPRLTGAQLSELAEYLEESNLPFKIDLVTVETLYPPYAPSIQNEKKLLLEF